MSDAEQGIAETQIKAGQDSGETLQQHHKWNIAYLDDRIFLYLGALAFLGLLMVWATAKSALVLYGSLAGAILLTVLWGVARLNRSKRLNEERARQVQALQSEKSD